MDGCPLTALGSAGEEVGGHLPLALHLDHAPAVQLVAPVHQHVMQVRGYLGDHQDTHTHTRVMVEEAAVRSGSFGNS